MKTKVYLQPSSRSGKKFMVSIIDANGKRKIVHFGAKGYSDYTKHKTKSRMRKYVKRHRSRENWNKSGMDTAGFWAKWILWDKPSLTASIKHVEERFNIDVIRGAPPKHKNYSKSRSRGRLSNRKPKRRSPSRKTRRRSP